MQNNLIRFDSFLNLALYSRNGYYMKKESTIEDFITLPEISHPFRKMIALYMKSEVENFNVSVPAIIELGSGSGLLSLEIARTLENVPVFAVEISEMRAFSADISTPLKNLHRVKEVDSIDKKYSVFCIANEFFDALPVRLFKKSKGKMFEAYLNRNQKNIVFTECKETPETVKSFLENIPDESLFEYSDAYRTAARKLSVFPCCRLTVIDYGFTINEIDRFPEGTIAGFKGHQFINDLEEIIKLSGEIDITHYVNFDFLIHDFASYGFRVENTLNLGLFIVEQTEKFKKDLLPEEIVSLFRAALPHRFGESFKVLVLSRSEIANL